MSGNVTIVREALRLLLDERNVSLEAAEKLCERARDCQTARHNDIRHAEAAVEVARARALEADLALAHADAGRIAAYEQREAVRVALRSAEEPEVPWDEA